MDGAYFSSDLLNKDHYWNWVIPFARTVPTLAPSAPHQHWHRLVALKTRHMSAEAFKTNSLIWHNLFSLELWVNPRSKECPQASPYTLYKPGDSIAESQLNTFSFSRCKTQNPCENGSACLIFQRRWDTQRWTPSSEGFLSEHRHSACETAARRSRGGRPAPLQYNDGHRHEQTGSYSPLAFSKS